VLDANKDLARAGVLGANKDLARAGVLDANKCAPLEELSALKAGPVIIIDSISTSHKRDKYIAAIADLLPGVPIFYWEIDTSLEVCIFLNLFKLQITKNNKVRQYSRGDLQKYFENARKMGPPHGENIKYIKFPLIMRTRPEIYYKYTE
jgi:hypothetical protein